MTEESKPSKMSWPLTLTLLLLGHATTAAWNSFLNNEEYFKFKLRGGKAAEKSAAGDEKNQLNCAMAFAQYGSLDALDKQIASIEDACAGNCTDKIHCQYQTFNRTLVINQELYDEAKKTRVSVIFDDFDEQMNAYFASPDIKSSALPANTTETEGPDYVTFWGTTLSSIALIITFLAANFAGMIIPHTGENLRINIMLVIASLIFVVHIFMAWFLESITSFFIITLITVVIVILTSGIAQCSFFTVIGPMDSSFVVKLMEGQGLGGIVIAVFVIILDKLFKRNGSYGTDNMTMETAIKANVTIFFGTTILALLGAIYCYHKIFKTSEPYRKCHQRAVSSTISTNLSGNGEENVLINTNSEKTECISTGVIIQSIWKMMLSVFLNFFLCLSIFPACLTSIKWQKSDTDIFGIKTADWSFIKYSVFLTFNIGDWLGKKFGGVSYSSDKENLTLFLQVVKMPIFWGLFWICDLTGTGTGILANGYFFSAVVLVFATSTGYFGTIPMAHASQILQRKLGHLHSDNEIKAAQGKAMPIMVASLVGGLMIGAFFSAFSVSLLEAAKQESRLEFQFATIDKLIGL